MSFLDTANNHNDIMDHSPVTREWMESSVVIAEECIHRGSAQRTAKNARPVASGITMPVVAEQPWSHQDEDHHHNNMMYLIPVSKQWMESSVATVEECFTEEMPNIRQTALIVRQEKPL